MGDRNPDVAPTELEINDAAALARYRIEHSYAKVGIEGAENCRANQSADPASSTALGVVGPVTKESSESSSVDKEELNEKQLNQ